MLKKLASSFILASAIVATAIAPSFADDETFKDITQFKFKVVGSVVGGVVGVPLGAVKDGVKEGRKATRFVAKTMGNEDCEFYNLVGLTVGAPFGFVGGAAYGSVDGLVHGFKSGYDKPFTHSSFTYKDE
jgi:hypothetical protein